MFPVRGESGVKQSSHDSGRVLGYCFLRHGNRNGIDYSEGISGNNSINMPGISSGIFDKVGFCAPWTIWVNGNPSTSVRNAMEPVLAATFPVCRANQD